MNLRFVFTVYFEDKDADGQLTTELATTNPDDLEVLQRLWYYPFGMEMEAVGQALTTPYQGARYNGKELEQVTGVYDYGARWYDAAIGRWGQVDPLAEHPNQVDKSPYAYAWNNPVLLNDPDGRCPICKLLAKGATGAAIDYFMQGAINFAQGMDLGDAFALSNIDKTSVFISGLQGAWSVPGGKYVSAAAAALGDVIINAGRAASNGEDYSTAQAGEDFLVGFVAQLGAKRAGDFFGNGVEFSADLSKTRATSRSGHANAGNKQLNDAMSSDPNLRKKMEGRLGDDVYDRTSTSGKGRRNPKGYEWDHNTNDPNRLDLRSKENHAKKTASDPGRKGGYSKYWKDKQ